MIVMRRVNPLSANKDEKERFFIGNYYWLSIKRSENTLHFKIVVNTRDEIGFDITCENESLAQIYLKRVTEQLYNEKDNVLVFEEGKIYSSIEDIAKNTLD